MAAVWGVLVVACSSGGQSTADSGSPGGAGASPSAGDGGASAGGRAGTAGEGGEAGMVVVSSLSVYDIIADPVRDLFYVSVVTNSPTNANTVAALDPATGAVLWTVPIPQEPYRLALSDDGAFLYVDDYDSTDGIVRRINVATRAIDLQFAAGSTPAVAMPKLGAIAVVPGAPHTVVVALAFGGIAVYDDGVRRPNFVDYSVYPAGTFQVVDATTLYALDIVDTGGNVYTLSLDSSGLSVTALHFTSFTDFMPAFSYEGSLLFGEDGNVLGGASLTLVGSYDVHNSQGPVVSNSAANRTYFLESINGAYPQGSVAVYDRTTYQFLGSATLPFGYQAIRIAQAPDGTVGAAMANASLIVSPILVHKSLLP